MIVLSSLMIHVERFTPAILLPPRMATQRNRHSCPFLCVEFFIGKTRYCMERGCFKSWVFLKHPRELKIKSLYSNDLIFNIAFKSKQAVQKLKFSDSSRRGCRLAEDIIFCAPCRYKPCKVNNVFYDNTVAVDL